MAFVPTQPTGVQRPGMYHHLTTLQGKIDYARIRRQPSKDATATLADALIYIELLQDGSNTTSAARTLPPHILREKLRARVEKEAGSSGIFKEAGALSWKFGDKFVTAQNAGKVIDALIQAKESGAGESVQILGKHRQTRRRLRPRTHHQRAVAEANSELSTLQADLSDRVASKTDSNDIEVPAAEAGGVHSPQPTQRVEGMHDHIDQALKKMDAWAEDWLGGRMQGDEGWGSFVNCLDREDL